MGIPDNYTGNSNYSINASDLHELEDKKAKKVMTQLIEREQVKNKLF